MRPTDIPVLRRPGTAAGRPIRPDLIARTVAMASQITVRVPDSFDDPTGGVQQRGEVRRALDDALSVFHEVDRTCTRFQPDSDLMRANARPYEWVAVEELCFDALHAAYQAYLATGGRFDPRILADLVRLGYSRSFALGAEERTASDVALRREPLSPWRPEFRRPDRSVRLSQAAGQSFAGVDLGGIGKGLSVRWASQRLLAAGVKDHLVDAGGDCYCSGRPSDGDHWRVGIEDPRGGADPVAVLHVSDEAVTTSSVRLRHWRAGGRDVHHIVDPATGQPGGSGLHSVTVAHPDPATAEIWGKVLFLSGANGIEAEAERCDLPALWVEASGAVGFSSRLGDRLLWRRS
ncbi:MAG TPA: FAD:protein FMN transferase [Mycobacteriales bacterium]|nr:FAD:protein FMN transferase [Mycobacteriales bacterium]